jgi:hypothetical protein
LNDRRFVIDEQDEFVQDIVNTKGTSSVSAFFVSFESIVFNL